MMVSLGERIEKKLIKNLLDAHDRFPPSSSVLGYILLTHFILCLAKKRKNVMIELIPEEEQ